MFVASATIKNQLLTKPLGGRIVGIQRGPCQEQGSEPEAERLEHVADDCRIDVYRPRGSQQPHLLRAHC